MAETAETIHDFGDDAAANDIPNVLQTSVGRVLAIRPEREVDRAILAFPAALIGQLPVAVTLELAAGRPFAVVFDPLEADERRAAGEDVLDGADWEMVVTAAESDRLFAAQLSELVSMRREGPLALDRVLGGARPDAPMGWSVARVLERVGARVLRAAVAPMRALPSAA